MVTNKEFNDLNNRFKRLNAHYITPENENRELYKKINSLESENKELSKRIRSLEIQQCDAFTKE